MRTRMIKFLSEYWEVPADDWTQYTDEQLVKQVMFTSNQAVQESKKMRVENERLRSKLYLAEWKLRGALHEVNKLKNMLDKE